MVTYESSLGAILRAKLTESLDSDPELLKPLPDLAAKILGSSDLMRIAAKCASSSTSCDHALRDMLEHGECDEIDLFEFAKGAAQLGLSIEACFEITPLVEIIFDSGESTFLSNADFVRAGVVQMDHMVSVAASPQLVLISVSCASGQGGRSWLWDPYSREERWSTSEAHGLTACIPGTGLFVIHQEYYDAVTPSTHWLMSITPSAPTQERVISLDNISWEEDGTHVDGWPRKVARPRDPAAHSYACDVPLENFSGLRRLARCYSAIYYDDTSGIIYIQSDSSKDDAVVFAISIKDLEDATLYVERRRRTSQVEAP